MAKRGRPPGYPRSGGRQKGTPNKVTREIKEALAKQVTAGERARARNPDQPDSLDRLRIQAMRLDKLAGDAFTRAAEQGADVKHAADLVWKSGSMWDKVAEYEHPKLAATTLRTDPERPLTTRLEIEFVGRDGQSPAS